MILTLASTNAFVQEPVQSAEFAPERNSGDPTIPAFSGQIVNAERETNTLIVKVGVW
jgi:hypothetical protein